MKINNEVFIFCRGEDEKMDYQKLIEKRNKSGHFGGEIGTRILEIGEGYAYGEISIKKIHTNTIGTVHGGVIFTFADMVGSSATMAYGDQVTTSNATVNFLNAPVGSKKLIGKAKEIKHGKTIMVVDVDITDEKGTLIAATTFTFYNLRKKITLDDED
jgi:acyl-CoA thioesterase